MHKRLLIALLLGLFAFAGSVPQAAALTTDESRRYSRVASCIRDAERAISDAKSYRNRAESYQRDADRYMQRAQDCQRQGNQSSADRYFRDAERAAANANDYLRRAAAKDAVASVNLHQASILLDTR